MFIDYLYVFNLVYYGKCYIHWIKYRIISYPVVLKLQAVFRKLFGEKAISFHNLIYNFENVSMVQQDRLRERPFDFQGGGGGLVRLEYLFYMFSETEKKISAP